MLKAHAVIGANYGDEGKGLMTDYLCSELGADVVVRFNGGAQAGHTVVTPEGERHVFHHLACGSFLGVPTLLSRFFITNPILYWQEEYNRPRTVYVSKNSVVTLPMDMFVNQAVARANGHGSCGVGIHETVRRNLHQRHRMTVADMMSFDLYDSIHAEYFPARLRENGLVIDESIDMELWRDIYFHKAELFLNSVTVVGDKFHVGPRILFEGAQGLMLDQKSPDFPHVTCSNTGIKNVKQLCAEWGVNDLRATYVTRSYLTRHGNGPLPNEQAMPEWVNDDTNIEHPFQGRLRYAPLDVLAVERRIIRDAEGTPLDVAITHCDQHDEQFDRKFALPVSYKAFGNTRLNVHDSYLV